ncbi:universal stress protein [Pseudoduganella sp. UC29_71]|uniref:universal stress protein n=1 Tax=Pseudoduganella sp. UC29_71 TaxID=3350174 RepID=UPI003672F299
MSPSILLPLDGNPDAAPAIAHCMHLARAQSATVVALYLQPYDDLSSPAASAVRDGDVLRTVAAVAAAIGVPCVALTRAAASPYAEIIAAARERQCDLVYLGAMKDQPTGAQVAALQQAGLGLAPAALAPAAKKSG